MDPGDFFEEFVPELWPDDAVETDTSELEGRPGAGLAAALAAVVPAGLDGDGLLTAVSAWRRLGAWAKAGELEAVTAFLNRRTGGSRGFESAVSELELELTLTSIGSGRLLELAYPLSDRLPSTRQALRDGVIDEAKARIIARAVEGVLDPAAAGRVERQVLPGAAAQTTGQLRHAVERAVIDADPEAAERRRRSAESGRRVEIRPTDAHTADLCGRDLPADQAIAADQRITALARARKNDGDAASLTFLRAQVYLDLLLGAGSVPDRSPAADLPDRHTDGPTPVGARTEGGPDAGMGSGVKGTVHVIVPIDTLRGVCDRPGEVPGYGAVPADVARTIAAHATDRSWCYSIVDDTGREIGHTHSRSLATGCPPSTEPGIRHPKGAYRPSDSLRHLIEARDRTCRFPACRRPARQCDLDHTRPYDDGGPTCACNLAPLCRKHHRLKQTQGWALTQPEPGHLTWVTPSGRRYLVTPDSYAATELVLQ